MRTWKRKCPLECGRVAPESLLSDQTVKRVSIIETGGEMSNECLSGLHSCWAKHSALTSQHLTPFLIQGIVSSLAFEPFEFVYECR